MAEKGSMALAHNHQPHNHKDFHDDWSTRLHDPVGVLRGSLIAGFGSVHSLNSVGASTSHDHGLGHGDDCIPSPLIRKRRDWKAEPEKWIRVPAQDLPSSWVIVLASCISFTLVGGYYMAFGMLYPHIVEEYQSGYGIAGWIGSIGQALGLVLGVVYSMIVTRWGSSRSALVGGLVAFVGYVVSFFATNILFLFLCYGVVIGCGMGMLFLSNIVIVHQHFEKHRALASGLSQAGISLGTITASVVFHLLVVEYGWRGGILIMGAIVLNAIPCALLYQPPRLITVKQPLKEQDESNDAGDKQQSSDEVLNKLALLGRPPYLLYCFGTFFMHLGVVSFYTHTPSRAMSYGSSPDKASYLLLAAGLSTLAGRVIGGFIGNLNFVSCVVQYGMAMFVGGIVNVCYFLSTTNFMQLAIHCTIFGFCNGLFFTVQSTGMVEILSPKEAAAGQGILGFFMGFGFLLSTPLAGFIYDVTGDYDVPFFVLGSLELLGSFMILSIKPLIMLNIFKTSSTNIG